MIGVDEAGRGPWAGEVVAGAVMLPDDFSPANYIDLADLRDSKKLTANKRESLFAALMAHQQQGTVSIGVGMASVAEIDRLNILQATLLAMRRAVMALVGSSSRVAHSLWVDGNQVPRFSAEELLLLPPSLIANCRALVGGDDSCPAISAASVVAKVTRDRLMQHADTLYPGYGFAQHKGYGTTSHRAAIINLGVLPIHRASFAPIKAMLPVSKAR